MADEQVQTSLSTDSTPSDGTSGSTPSEAPSESSSGPGWWQRMFNRRDSGENGPTGREEKPEAQTSGKLELTEEELHRRVQAEADRREAKRQTEHAREQRRKLRDEDPWQYAQQERDAEQSANAEGNFMGQLHQIGSIHDRTTIDPLLEMLPQSERDRILKLDGAGVGLAGRTLIVKEALKALEKSWKGDGGKDAERKLRTNPAFRKQLLAEMRGQRAGEPDLLPASSGSDNDHSLSRLLRDYYIGG